MVDNGNEEVKTEINNGVDPNQFVDAALPPEVYTNRHKLLFFWGKTRTRAQLSRTKGVTPL